jgi:hypothetical protein
MEYMTPLQDKISLRHDKVRFLFHPRNSTDDLVIEKIDCVRISGRIYDSVKGFYEQYFGIHNIL